MITLKIGKTYKMHHSRKGDAVVKVFDIDGEWIDCQVVSGRLKGMGAGSLRDAGDMIRVRDCLATFTEIGRCRDE